MPRKGSWGNPVGPEKHGNAPNATQSSASVQFTTVSCSDSSTYSNVIFDRAPPGGRGPIPHRPAVCCARYFDRLHGRATTRGNFRFSASAKEGTLDQWSPFRLTAGELPSKIMSRLEGFGH